MFRLTLLVTAIISFLHFAFPQSFTFVKTGDVLGINKIETAANLSVVETAVQIYCINNGFLPQKLNILYQNELSKKRYLDLDKNFELKNKQNCDFTLTAK